MSFSTLSSVDLPSIEARLDRFVHSSGLRHFHLNNDAIAPTFMICFPTLPENDDGRPHVLEHLALSGSRAYPVREVFFRAHERSLASFMNAMTDDATTMYPFVTPHLDDYRRLMGVYLDAVFHPTLDRADYLQEGFRIETDAQGKAVFQGVVFNEMISALESPERHALSAIRAELYPNSALRLNAGGDPLVISSLTHEKIQAFHRKSYHPAHAVVFTAGPAGVVPVTHAGIETTLGAESLVSAGDPPTLPAHELHDRRKLVVPLPMDSADHQLFMVWPLAPVQAGVDAWVQSQLAELLFLDESGPLSLAQQEAELGRIGPLSHVAHVGTDQWLMLHFQGLEPHQVIETEHLVNQILAEVTQHGLPDDLLRRFRRDVEVELRRITDLGPEGALDRFLGVAATVLYQGQDLDAVLPALLDMQGQAPLWHDQLAQPQTVQRFAAMLQNSEGALVIHGVPDEQFHFRRGEIMDQQRQAASVRLAQDPAFRAQVHADMARVKARHAEESSADVLPSFPVASIPRQRAALTEVREVDEGLLVVPAHTPGLMSLSLTADMSGLSLSDSQELTALLTVLLPGLGEENEPWQASAARRQKAGVDIHARVSGGLDQAGHAIALADLRGLTRVEEGPALAEAFSRMLSRADLSVVDRLGYLMLSERDAHQDELTSNGSEWSKLRLAAGVHRRGELTHQLDGLPSVVFWQNLVQRFEQQPDAFLAHLQAQLARLRGLTWRVVVSGDARGEASGRRLRDDLQGQGLRLASRPTPVASPFQSRPQQVALVSPQRSGGYHGAAWAGPTAISADSANLMLLGAMLTGEELWPRLREKGGAYGAAARWERGLFKMSSHRDPRLAGTFEDFELTRQRALTAFSIEQVDHAKRQVFQNQDRPLEPLARASQAIEHFWRGETASDLQAQRDFLLSATPDQIAATANAWLAQAPHSRVAFIDDRARIEAQELGLTCEALPTPVLEVGEEPEGSGV